MITTATATQAERPLIVRSRAELERAVIEAACELCVARFRGPGSPERRTLNLLVRLDDAVLDLAEWKQLRAEAAG
ncbi:MAG TPA: hypothetical protein VNM48_05510 [Chloroflexota bacterium]|nr:hypothetical protein [Chloroflexota bacterium]